VPNSKSEKQIFEALQVLNADKNFTSSRQRVEYQLRKIEDTLKAQVKDLFYERKFDIHTLFKNSEEKDLQDLTLL
jgi:flagellar motility protein MotE (MotC chaperone)